MVVVGCNKVFTSNRALSSAVSPSHQHLRWFALQQSHPLLLQPVLHST